MASRETSERPCTPACALGNWPSCQYWAWGLEGADLRTETLRLQGGLICHRAAAAP